MRQKMIVKLRGIATGHEHGWQGRVAWGDGADSWQDHRQGDLNLFGVSKAMS